MAAVQHMREWALGSAEGNYASMAIYSDGKHYDVPEGIVYSFPVVCQNGSYKIVDGRICVGMALQV
jgi:malate dehydrogenase